MQPKMIIAAALAMLALIPILAGCGIIPGVGPDPRTDAEPVASVTCPETYADGYAQAGLVPSEFQPVAVLRCDPYASREDSDGVWSGALLERLEGDLENVLAALAQPSDPLSIGACPAIGYLLPEMWVEGTDGTVVRIAVPTDGCGAPKNVGLDAALSTLTVTQETFTRETLIQSPTAAAAGEARQPAENSPAPTQVLELLTHAR